MKIKKGQRIEIVKELIDKNLTYKELSEKYNINMSAIHRYVQIYKLHGEEALYKTSNLNGKEKIDMIESMIANNWSLNYTSIKYNVAVSSVRDWFNLYKKEGPNSLANLKPGRKIMIEKMPKINKRRKELKNLSKEEMLEIIERQEIENYYYKRLIELMNEEDPKKKDKNR